VAELSPAYLSALAAQLGGLSAFLGGFAATFLGTLLYQRKNTKILIWAIGFTVVASVAFVVTVVSSTALIATLHPDAPASTSAPGSGGARVLLFVGFTVGLYSLLGSLALSGFSRSRITGFLTTIAASVGIVLVTMLVVGIG